MDKINKAAAAGVVFFSIILAGFVGIKVDQTTIAILGGAFIGLVVAIPTTALIMIVGLRKRDEPARPGVYHYHDQRPAQPVFPQQQAGSHLILQNGQLAGWTVVNPNQQPAQPEWGLDPVKRRFYVIGDGGDVQEIEPPRGY